MERPSNQRTVMGQERRSRQSCAVRQVALHSGLPGMLLCITISVSMEGRDDMTRRGGSSISRNARQAGMPKSEPDSSPRSWISQWTTAVRSPRSLRSRHFKNCRADCGSGARKTQANRLPDPSPHPAEATCATRYVQRFMHFLMERLAGDRLGVSHRPGNRRATPFLTLKQSSMGRTRT